MNLSILARQYAERESKAHHPATRLAILVDAYATGIFSSRQPEQATYDLAAFRHIAVGSHPDHDSLATFRRRFFNELSELFVQVLEIAKQMKLLKPSGVCLNSTKIKANASQLSARSHAHIELLEVQLKAEGKELFALAEQADQADVRKGVRWPEEIKRREGRSAVVAIAKAKIAVHVQERYQREKAEYNENMGWCATSEKAISKKLGGQPPQASAPGVQHPGGRRYGDDVCGRGRHDASSR